MEYFESLDLLCRLGYLLPSLEKSFFEPDMYLGISQIRNSLFIAILFHTTDNFICSIVYQIMIVTLICIDLRRTEIKAGIRKQENN